MYFRKQIDCINLQNAPNVKQGAGQERVWDESGNHYLQNQYRDDSSEIIPTKTFRKIQFKNHLRSRLRHADY